jgi:cytochrome c-type biogenesis protein CcmE
MTRKQRRGMIIGGAVVLLTIALGLVLFAMRDTVVFFYSPTELAEQNVQPGSKVRIGGLVVDGSIKRGDGLKVAFAVTDTAKTVNVSYEGILPDLFREGQGVVAEGILMADGSFAAETVLAKHDENYMPPEVADALKKRGIKLDGSQTHPGAKGAESPASGS